MEVLKQSQYNPYKVEEQVVSFYCVTNGYFDDVPTEKVRAFEHDLVESLRTENEILSEIKREEKVTDEIKEKLNEYVAGFKQDYVW